MPQTIVGVDPNDRRAMRECDDPVPCPRCRKLGRRAVSGPLLGMDAGRRRAHAINEKSQHEPKTKRMSRGEHGHHGHSHKGLERSRHPWMIGH